MVTKFKDAGYMPEKLTEAKSPEPTVMYPCLHLDGDSFSDIGGDVGDDVMFTIKGKITSKRKDKYGSCIDVEVREVGVNGNMKADATGGNDADKSLSKLEGKL